MFHLGHIIQTHAALHPDNEAVIFNDTRLTYRDFDLVVEQLAAALHGAGFRAGQKIATQLPNCVELLALYWASARTGLVVVPLSPLLQGAGLAGLLVASDAEGFFVSHHYSAQLDEIFDHLEKLGAQTSQRLTADKTYIVGQADNEDCAPYQLYQNFLQQGIGVEFCEPDIEPDDLYNIIFSSGTTGEPKGIMHSHAVRAMYCTLFANCWRMTPESVVMHTGAIIFNGAYVTMMPSFYLGAKFILGEYFDPEKLIATIEREKVTHIMLVPSQIIALLNSPEFAAEKLSSLEMILSLGAPLHLEHKQQLDKHLPGIFYELYGVTEGFITILDRDDFHSKSGTVGAPMAFNEVKIVNAHGEEVARGDVGEIIGRGPLASSGYYKRPDLTAQGFRDGWIYSGDLGKIDDDGYLTLVDRKKDMIISGGINVYPRDIEEVIVQHEAAEEVAVIGVKDDKWGETPVAIIVLHKDRTITADEMKTWINSHVAAKYQRVSQVIFRDEFPRNAAGKILKRVLQDEIAL